MGLFSLEKRGFQTDLIVAFQYLKGDPQEVGDGLSTRACGDRTRGNGFTLKEGRFTLDIRKKFFTMVRHWNRLPRVVVDASSTGVIKARLNGVLNHLI